MLVILTEEQVLSTQQVCQDCLLADRTGLPRWHAGKLDCGRSMLVKGGNSTTASPLYECKMGFRIVSIDESRE